ncbi:hypothetical protein [Microlunatus sp. GCM10028923]|uniref:hypothetical protein n=1 Tax=Microlunatus sp. GCM10028923 TaxID=3273400 RepID=UPI0036193660
MADQMTARARVRRLLDHGHGDDPELFGGSPPAPLRRSEPENWLWRGAPHPATGFGLRDQRAYTQLVDPADAEFLHRPVAAALGEKAAASAAEYTPQQQRYLRRSVDVTMKGGTASGVIYPLAVCEIARRFRLRNVGGSSAGAIAAAFAASAEVGRAGQMAPETSGESGPPADEPAAPRQGRVRAGFVGLADIVAWMTQADEEPQHEDEYRMGQLFKATQVSRSIFRMIIAVMRGRLAQVPLLITAALGPVARIFTAAALLGAPLVAMDWRSPAGPVIAYLVSLGWLLALSLMIISAVVIGVLVLQRLKPLPEPPAGLAEPVERPGRRSYGSLWLPITALGLGALLSVGLAAAADQWATVGPWRMILVWVAMIQVVIGIQLAAVLKIMLTARGHRFGLLSGADPENPPPANGWERFWDRVAGSPSPTVPQNLIDWMHAVLSDLAGLSRDSADPAVLRFGHLWFGAGFDAATTPRERLDEAARSADHRLVNLELMASELVHGVSLRFPLRIDELVDEAGAPRLFVRRSDLGGGPGPVLPAAVVDAVCAGAPVTAHDVVSGETVTDLHPLPMPWDLPVLFAVRLSMALPGLFQDVRLYRTDGSAPVRDDFGIRLVAGDGDLDYPPRTHDSRWVQELWLSDGGITSNFPIHFFDTPLPLWPTLGINLGQHPRGAAHQDVWLPDEMASGASGAGTLGGSMLGFAWAVFGTAMSWRDNAQTFMPAFRGRVAWVRQRSDEGGTNLFMDVEQISTLALRGALAGARLSRRYANDGQWHRHQWLRLRVALDNLNALLDQSVASLRDPIYGGLSADGLARLDAIMDAIGAAADPAPPRPDGTAEPPLPWFTPDGGFWPDAAALLAAVQSRPRTERPAALNAGVPLPAPSLRQVPPT